MNRTARAAIITAVTIIAAVVAAVAIAVTLDSPDEVTPDNGTVARHDTEGNQRRIVVEVETDDNLDAVFNDIIDDLTDDAGYYISINCSASNNRLANGRYALGGIGQAATGLGDGESTFDRIEGATCP